MTEVNPEIAALHRLQKEDRKVLLVERRLKAIPRRLKELDDDLAKLKKMLDDERDRLSEVEQFRDTQEMQLANEEEHVKNSKARLNSIKTSRELTATQKEIESTRRMMSTRSEELERIRTAIEETTQRIDGMQTGFDDLAKKAGAEREKMEEEQGKYQKILRRAHKNRSKLTEGISQRTLRTYERIRTKSGGLGFVATHRRICTACKMQVPHQAYVTLKRGEELVNCENCGRLLYFAGLFPDEEEKLNKPKEAPKKRPKTAPEEGAA